jgi:hypothetical protein
MSKHKKHHHSHDQSRRDHFEAEPRRGARVSPTLLVAALAVVFGGVLKVSLAVLGDVLSAVRRRLSGMEMQHQGCAASHLQRISAVATKVPLAAVRFDDTLHRS